MLPKNLKYGSKVESSLARSYRTNIAPMNGTGPYQLGDTVIINIPTRANLVMVPTESYLKFNLQPITATGAANSATALRFDSCGAHGLFSRIRIFHGSNLLEDIDSYGLLAKMMFDLQVSPDQAYGRFNMLAGTRNDTVTVLPSLITTDLDNNISIGNALGSQNLSSIQVNSGELLKSGVHNLVRMGEASTVQTYCLNLVSLVGTLCSQNYLPLFAMTSAPLRVELTLVDTLTKAINVTLGTKSIIAPTTTDAAAAAPTIANGIITNVEYIGNFIELGDAAIAMIYESLQGSPLQFVIPSYRNYQGGGQLTADANTQLAIPIPAKFSSLKSLLLAFRNTAQINAASFFPYSSCRSGIVDYQFRIGSNVMPAKAPNTTCEMFAEALKAMGSMSDLNYEPAIDKDTYSLNANIPNVQFNERHGASRVSSGSFYLGLDLENYSGASKDTIFAGWNSNTDDIFAMVNFVAPATYTLRVDTFAMFDAVLVCENNTCFVRF